MEVNFDRLRWSILEGYNRIVKKCNDVDEDTAEIKLAVEKLRSDILVLSSIINPETNEALTQHPYFNLLSVEL
jgi:hypothetical protein